MIFYVPLQLHPRKPGHEIRADEPPGGIAEGAPLLELLMPVRELTSLSKDCSFMVWLTSEEIASENHFYKIDPASDGLVAYWKFDDNTKGKIVKAALFSA